MVDRAQLEAWIAETERHQRRLRAALVPAVVVALVLLVFSRPIGGMAIAIVLITAVLGFWIMASHIADWTTKLDDLERPRPDAHAVKRRYEPDG
jgi:hypothetical protein